jgi:hypothetical protein
VKTGLKPARSLYISQRTFRTSALYEQVGGGSANGFINVIAGLGARLDKLLDKQDSGTATKVY